MKPNFQLLNNGITKNNNHPLTLAMMSKLRSSTDSVKRRDFGDLELSNSLLQTKAMSRDKIEGNDDILVLFPDTSLAIEMIISSMLSPNDFVTKNLLYHCPENLDITPSMQQELMKIIKDHMNQEYKFESKFSDIIKEALFTKGSYVEIIIPEASLDDYINKPSLENYQTSHGHKYLGDLKSYDLDFIKNKLSGLEFNTENLKSKFNVRYKNNSSVNVSCNLEGYNESNIKIVTSEQNNKYTKQIKLPKISDRESSIKSSSDMLKRIASDIYSEKYNRKYDNDMNLDMIFKKGIKGRHNQSGIEIINTANNASRKSIGKPLVMKIPAECVIPVHAVNDPKTKIGYFIAIDQDGTPLNASNEIQDMLRNNTNPYGNTYGNGREFVDKGKNNLYDINDQDPMFEENERIYTQIVEEMIKRKIKNGSFGELATIQSNVDIYRMMFYRTLRDRETQLIYLPDELVTYWAFNFRPNGTGESLLERVAPLFSIRGILLMVTILSYIKNSTTTTKVTVSLDENEAMPEARAEEIMNFLMQNRDRQFPLGMMRIYELQDWAIRSGYKFDIQSPNLPEIKIDADQENPNFKVPDTELDEMFFEKILNTFGIVPEMVKQGLDPDFATTTTLRNVLNNNRIKEKQKTFNELASTAIKKFIKSDPTLREKLIVYLANNIESLIDQYIQFAKDENTNQEDIRSSLTKEDKMKMIAYVIDNIEEGMYVTLPEPRSTEAPLLYNAISTEFQQIDDIITHIFDSSALTSEDNGELASKMETIKGIIAFQMKLDRLAENNLLPDTVEVFNHGNEGKSGSTIFNNFLANREAFIENSTKLLANIKGQTNVADTALSLIENGEQENSPSDESSQSNDEEQGSESNDDEEWNF